MKTQPFIRTGLGDFGKDKFNALVDIRAETLAGFRDALKICGYTEVTTSTLVNIAGSCENPHASFTLNYYGREAHLSQSAQIQLEKLVIGLKRGVFTINNSFREENYDDPEAEGRRLSEFTLVEPEQPYEALTPDSALDRIIEEQAEVIGDVIKAQLRESKIADYLREHARKQARQQGVDPEEAAKQVDPTLPFSDYFAVFEQEEPILRAGYGIGFERFVAFLLQSNDILETVAYRTLHPGG